MAIGVAAARRWRSSPPTTRDIACRPVAGHGRPPRDAKSLAEGARRIGRPRRTTSRSCELIANRLSIESPNEVVRVSHWAIYPAPYVQGRGALRRDPCRHTERAGAAGAHPGTREAFLHSTGRYRKAESLVPLQAPLHVESLVRD
jgi:hypothetical protein